MKTRKIKACIQVNSCNSDIRTWTNSIHVMVIQVYEIIMFSAIEHRVTVIRAHEITVSSITCVYMKYNIQCIGVSGALDDTSTGNINIHVMVIQVYKITMIQYNRISM